MGKFDPPLAEIRAWLADQGKRRAGVHDFWKILPKLRASPSTRQKILFSILIKAKHTIFLTPFIDTMAMMEIGQTRSILRLDYGLDGGHGEMVDGVP